MVKMALSHESTHSKRLPRWYFGGLAASGATVFTHPIDLIKVHMQTTSKKKLPFFKAFSRVYTLNGVLGLYNGVSAALLRQMTYSTTRFAIYGELKSYFNRGGDGQFTFVEMILMAGVSGFMGGLVGTPADMVNVRMQNDTRLPANQRRNYANGFDGLLKVYKEGGVRLLFSGIGFASGRATIVTIGQISFYEQVKKILLSTGIFEDAPLTHLIASVVAGASATILTQPLDVLKTRQMNSKPGEFNGVLHLIRHTAKMGPTAFFKGIVPASIRLGPHTVLQFMFFEQLILHFGYLPTPA